MADSYQYSHIALFCVVMLVATLTNTYAQDADDQTLSYRATLEGVEDSGLRTQLEAMSESVADQDEGANSPLHLRRRMNRDVDAFGQFLRSEGFYWHEIEVKLDESSVPHTAAFTLKLGDACRFGEIAIRSLNQEHSVAVQEAAKSMDLKSGNPARAEAVRIAETKLLSTLRESGYPFPSLADKKAEVDSESKTMNLTFVVDSGKRARFGELEISGLEHVTESVVSVERPWMEGDIFDFRQIELMRKRLYDTGLFTVVQVRPGEAAEDGTVPVLIDIKERDRRTLSLGANYYSDVGAGIIAKWQHRNLWGLGRQLDVESQFSQQIQSLGARLTLKNFRRRLQTLQFSLLAAAEDVDAYDSEHIGGRIWLTRWLPIEHMAAGVGVAARVTEIEQFGETNTYQLLSLPTEVSWDNSDDLLNPTKGLRVRGQFEPFMDLSGEVSEFFKSQISASHYWSLNENSTWILASRLKIGTVLGASTEDLPPDERYYSGGGGSVRGYPYQSLGPQFRDDPFGGSSVLETSVEFRYRISESFGAVAFVDGGSAFESEYPDFDEELRWGAGVGLRYFSPVGPFRFDVGVPINKPDYVDESFQVYLSIGQAF